MLQWDVIRVFSRDVMIWMRYGVSQVQLIVTKLDQFHIMWYITYYHQEVADYSYDLANKLWSECFLQFFKCALWNWIGLVSYPAVKMTYSQQRLNICKSACYNCFLFWFCGTRCYDLNAACLWTLFFSETELCYYISLRYTKLTCIPCRTLNGCVRLTLFRK